MSAQPIGPFTNNAYVHQLIPPSSHLIFGEAAVLALNAVQLHMEQLQLKGEAPPLATPTLVALHPIWQVLICEEGLHVWECVGVS